MNTRELTALLVLPVTVTLAGCAGGYSDTEAEPGAEPEEEEVRVERRTAEYARWDMNGDDVLSAEEFQTWLEDQELIVAWTGEEGELSNHELAEHLHTAWDANADGVVSKTEWKKGMNRSFPDEADRESWTDWDADGDSELDHNELSEGLETSGLYDVVDADNDAVIDDEELSDWFFDTFDLNDDDEIDVTEWDAARSAIGHEHG